MPKRDPPILTIRPVRALWIAAAIGVTISTLGQLRSPLHLLTHEFILIFGIAGAGSLVLLGRWLADHRHALSLPLACGFLMGASACAVQLLANALWWDCVMPPAIEVFWTTWIPLSVVAVVCGRISREQSLGFGKLLLLGVAVGVLCAIHDGLQGLRGFLPIDPLFGSLRALDQRASMTLSTVELYQRMWLFGVGVLLWNWHRGRRLQAWVLGLSLVLVTFGMGSRIGLGWGYGAIRSELRATHATEHFRLHYRPGGSAELRVSVIGRAAEWQRERLRRELHFESDDVVHIWLFEDEASLDQLTRFGAPHAVPRHFFLIWWDALRDTLNHEIVHAIYPSGLRVATMRGMTEGIATAWEQELHSVPEAHQELAGALSAGFLPDAETLMSPLGFFSINEFNAYQASGSFIGWLILQHGPEKMAALQRSPDFRDIYGRSLAELDADWRAFLASLTSDLENSSRGRERFDPELAPAYFERACPKLGSRREDPDERARRHFRSGDYLGALEIFMAVPEAEVGFHSQIQIVTCRQRLEQHEAVLDLLDSITRKGLADDQQERLRRLESTSRMALGQWEALYATFDERSAMTSRRNDDRDQIETALRNPDIRSQVARGLLLSGSEAASLFRSLYEADPDDPNRRYLAATRGLPIPTSPFTVHVGRSRREALSANLTFIEQVPEACDERGPQLLRNATTMIRLRDYEVAQKILRVVGDHCKEPMALHRAEVLGDRIAWERAPPRSF